MKAERAEIQSSILNPFIFLISLAWALTFFPLEWIALAASTLTAAFLLIRWPWLIWPAIAAVLPYTSSIKFGPASVTDLLLVIAAALWLANGARRHTLRLRMPIPMVPLALYLLALYLSTLGARDLAEAGTEMVKWIEFAVVLLMVSAMLPRRYAPWLAMALLLGAVGQALLGLYQFIYRIGPEWFVLFGRFMRASGSFKQPNPYAGYLGLTLPVAVSLALWSWRRRRQQGQGRSLMGWAIFYSGASIIIGLGLLASWSRGGWLGAAAGVGLVFALRSRRSMIASGLALSVLACVLLLGSFDLSIMPAPLTARVQEIPAYLGLTDVLNAPLTDENFAVVERVAHWVAALRMWERAPWLGVGPGNYAVIYPEVRLPLWEESLGHAHNIYLNALAETGVVGLAAYGVLWTTIILWAWRSFRRSKLELASDSDHRDSSWYAALSVGVLGVLAHLSVHNGFDNLFVQGMVLHLALLLAMVSGALDR